jgi:hypothetical protein
MNIGLRKRCFVLNGYYTVFSFLGKILQWLGITEKMGHQRHCPGPWRGRLPGVTHCPAGKSMPAIRPPWMSAAAFHGFSLWPLMPDCM